MAAMDGLSLQETLGRAAEIPLDPVTQIELGNIWLDRKRPLQASACYRTAIALSEVSPEVVLNLATAELQAGRPAAATSRLQVLREQAPGIMPAEVKRLEGLCRSTPETPLVSLDHNRHYRNSTLASYLKSIMGTDAFDILDVGGGDGLLAQYLPQTVYRLAEPDTNGIRGENLPFPAQSVDVVCACHVLEHIPPADRFDFLDSLRMRARHHLVLLNPFHVPGSHFGKRMQTMIDLTGAGWAEEHLACGLPEVSVVEEYARARELALSIVPNGNMPVSFLYGLMSHYARLAGHEQDLGRINKYLNTLDPDLVTNPLLPSAMLAHFRLD